MCSINVHHSYCEFRVTFSISHRERCPLSPSHVHTTAALLGACHSLLSPGSPFSEAVTPFQAVAMNGLRMGTEWRLENPCCELMRRITLGETGLSCQKMLLIRAYYMKVDSLGPQRKSLFSARETRGKSASPLEITGANQTSTPHGRAATSARPVEAPVLPERWEGKACSCSLVIPSGKSEPGLPLISHAGWSPPHICCYPRTARLHLCPVNCT